MQTYCLFIVCIYYEVTSSHSESVEKEVEPPEGCEVAHLLMELRQNKGITSTLLPPDTHRCPPTPTTHTTTFFPLFLSRSVTLHLPHPLPVPSSPLLFICFPSLLSQAFYCVTHADGAAPPLVPRLCRRAPEKVVAFVWQTCHLMPPPQTKRASSQVAWLHRQPQKALSCHNRQTAAGETRSLAPCFLIPFFLFQ